MNAFKYRRLHNRQPGQCTWCGAPVPKGRKKWCGDTCVDEFRAQNEWAFVRKLVFKRDRGICKHCGCDTIQLQRLCRLVRSREGFDTYRHLCDWLRHHGHHDVVVRDQWEADHIVERVRGGGNELTNLRTLCLECHKRETARLAAELATERKAAKRAKLEVLF